MDNVPNSFFIFWFCIFGLCLGSFYNVVILRSLTNESIVFPASKCPKCGNKLKPYHNIPIISYIFFSGKCAFCREKISLQYPIIELITALLFVYSFIKFGLEWYTLFVIILSSTLLIMSVTDLKEQLVDCNIAIGLGIIGIIYNWLGKDALVDSVLGLLVGVIIMELAAATGYFIKKTRAFGEADTFVAAALGACFGLKALPNIFLYTLIASMFFILPMFLYNQLQKGNKAICILFILFILSVLIYNNVMQNVYIFIVIAVLGIFLSVKILRNLREETSPLYLPLVPAFALGALYYLFF